VDSPREKVGAAGELGEPDAFADVTVRSRIKRYDAGERWTVSRTQVETK